MPINPAVKPEQLNNPTQRASQLNDPQFEAQQGYYPYDLTHCEILSARFGEITPSLHLDTVPGDRHLLKTNSKLLFNRIPGNLLSTLNQYVDSFYVPLRAVFPTNYEKLIPNPTKGDDLPNSALPQFPICHFVQSYLDDSSATYELVTESSSQRFTISKVMDEALRLYGDSVSVEELDLISFAIGRMTHLAYIFSRGQLLDYLGFQPDAPVEITDFYSSRLQYEIDRYFNQLYLLVDRGLVSSIRGAEISLYGSDFYFDQESSFVYEGRLDTLSYFRQSLSDIFERGNFLWLGLAIPDSNNQVSDFITSFFNLYDTFMYIFNAGNPVTIQSVDESPDPFATGQFINIGKFLAYQLAVAHYFTNDSVDNIFTSDLYMQNLRGCMFPALGQYTREPVFNYNGVSTEYDYISFGSVYASLLDSSNMPGIAMRQQVFMSLLFTLRRSLRYGDYFATARPRLLAVTDNLFINLSENEDGASGVSPIDVTKNLLMQRYLNAANYVGSKFLNYFASMYGVTPSDTGTFPRFLAHEKITLSNQITNNTSEQQGKQTTNIIAHNESLGFDVFIDDFGFLIQVTSFDTLPIYTSGIDSSFHFSDRFDYFNPMLQNIGDQPIRFSEMCGLPAYYRTTFGYTMRNAEYKYKLSKAHGAFVNGELAMLVRYPVQDFTNSETTKINPDFIRDKAMYIDSIMPDDGPSTGVSPAQYYHFAISFVNELHSARKIQATPPVLF